jgi:NitT/TauT family transport system substrate-binding protein
LSATEFSETRFLFFAGLSGAAIALALLFGCTQRGGAEPSSNQNGFAITLGELSCSTSHTPIYVALREGFFANAGLRVSIQQLSGGTPAAMAAFSDGAVDIMLASANEFIEYSAKKVVSGKLFGELVDASYDLVSASSIRSIARLKGKVIAISGPNGADQIYLEALLPHYGLSARDVTFLATGSPGNRLTALAAGSVQATAVGFGSRALSTKVGTILLAANESPVGIPGDLFFAHDTLIANHRDELKRFLGALVAATAWIREHPVAAARDCTHGTGLSDEVCNGGLATLTDPKISGKYTWSSTFAINRDGIIAALQIEATHLPEARTLTPERLVDSSIAMAMLH